jgi:hypothetical protein
MEDAKETLIPLVLAVIALMIFSVYGAVVAGPAGAGAVVTLVGLQVLVGVPLAILSFFITARLMSISFGFIGPAFRKVTAIYTFPAAVALIIPIPVLGWLVSFILYFALLAWFFELDPLELLVTALVLWATRIVALVIIAGIV